MGLKLFAIGATTQLIVLGTAEGASLSDASVSANEEANKIESLSLPRPNTPNDAGGVGMNSGMGLEIIERAPTARSFRDPLPEEQKQRPERDLDYRSPAELKIQQDVSPEVAPTSNRGSEPDS